MFHTATNVSFLEDVTIEVTYRDGKVFRYDMSKLFLKYPQLEELRRNRQLFESGQIDPGGYGIVWNDKLDVDATGIYEDGIFIRQEEISINVKIGLLLAKTRAEKGLTQSELAKISHIDQGDISKIEKGIGNPTLNKIAKLFDALGAELTFKVK